jgi:hypothetical protein
MDDYKRISPIHTCGSCKRGYIKSRGKEQNECLLCLRWKLTAEEMEETFPWKEARDKRLEIAYT